MTMTAASRRAMYYMIALAFAVLIVIGLFTFRSRRADATTNAKAGQLIAALEAQGLRAPAQDQIVRVLGDDGGPLRADPGSALNRAIALGMLSNGAGGPGLRPVIAASNVLKGQQTAIAIYCPQEPQKFQNFVNDLRLENTVGS